MNRQLLPLFLLAAAPALAAETALEPASFEDLDLPAGQQWTHDDSDPDYTQGTFRSGSFIFPNYWDSQWQAWAFAGYASLTETDYTDPSCQMRCAYGRGHDSSTYGVIFDDTFQGPTIVEIDEALGETEVPGVWACASAWVKHAVLWGDGLSGPFESGDYCSMMVSGRRADDTWAGPVQIRLADYTSPDPAEWYVLDEWNYFPLTSLGKITALRWNFSSTKKNAWGITTPSYICIDDLGAKGPDSGIPVRGTMCGRIEVYNTSGQKIWDGENLPGGLDPGVYIIKEGNRVRKLAVPSL